jgi:hypothetical protein
MTEKIQEFKDRWYAERGYISLELTDGQIASFITRFPSLTQAIDMAVDYLLANGLSEVQE